MSADAMLSFWLINHRVDYVFGAANNCHREFSESPCHLPVADPLDWRRRRNTRAAKPQPVGYIRLVI
jgi:hypothetical protein